MMCDGCGDVGCVWVQTFVLCPHCVTIFPTIVNRLWRERAVFWAVMLLLVSIALVFVRSAFR